MKRQKKLIVGNWKMNPQRVEDAKKIVGEVKKGIRNVKKTQVVLCPPFVYLSSVSSSFKAPLFLGAQDAFYETLGSFTGEVSYTMLQQFKTEFVIVGHSERRKMGEKDEDVNKKVRAVVSCGMTAITCVGESDRDHGGEYLHFIRKQITDALNGVPKKSLSQVVVAYEPIWAIGAKESMTPRDLHETSIFIKKVLVDLFGTLAGDVRIIYGGAVDRTNADRLVKEGNVSGLLIGRESLKPKEFAEIIKLVEAI